MRLLAQVFYRLSSTNFTSSIVKYFAPFYGLWTEEFSRKTWKVSRKVYGEFYFVTDF